MEEEIVYTYILIKTDGTYLGWSKAEKEETAGDGMEWIEWGKELPIDIDIKPFKYEDGAIKEI
jgi:hypothetical protein